MRLDTVEILTHDRNLAQRHISFLTAERKQLQAQNNLSIEQQLRLEEIATRLNDCELYLHTRARDSYNRAEGIPLYKDPRGRRTY